MPGHILMTAVNAVAPIIALIGLGYFLKRAGILNDAFLKTANWLVFHICIPAMLFINVYDIESLGLIRWDMALYCMAVMTLLFGLGWVQGLAATADPRRRGVIWQCAFRSNFAIIGLPLAQALGGDQGAAVAAVLSAFAIPAFNVYAVIALSAYTGKKKGARKLIRGILLNPLVVGVALGLLALVLRAVQQAALGRIAISLREDLSFGYQVLKDLKNMTTPLALIVLGGQCEFSGVKGMFREIAVSVTTRVVIAPLLALCGAVALHKLGLMPCSNGEYAALIALFGSPVAVSSAIMARNMDNDHQLATQLVVWTSILSVATIFLTVCILMGAGLLIV